MRARGSTMVLVMAAVLVIAVGCGSDTGGDAVDARPGPDAIPQGTPDGPGPLSCAAYCTRMEAACVGTNAQYAATAECLASCETWQFGSQGAMTGNTLGCRTYHAGAAIENAGLHCRHAGPGGDGACGTNCEGFCTLAVGVCTGADAIYATIGECMTACSGYPAQPPYAASVQSGDSLACRLYHATAASTDPVNHCPHTADDSTPCQ